MNRNVAKKNGTRDIETITPATLRCCAVVAPAQTELRDTPKTRAMRSKKIRFSETKAH